MRKVAVLIIIFYQAIISVVLKNLGLKPECRYDVSCSAYTKHAILSHGIFKGSLIGLKRILSCQPFFHKQTI